MSDFVARLQSTIADRYAIDREIGRGGMATVFLAEDLKHGRQVAIKVLHPELAASVGGDRFLREIEIAASLEHSHILSLIDSGEADGLVYYIMPYVDGESLRDRMQREKQLPIEEAIRIGREVADGLGHAHRQGVVHRDIKPANVMLSDGHVLIADFGVAKAVGSEGTALTRTGLAVGTPAYMSPEQAAGTEDVDARSDVYSLGCVIYEMLAGEPPLTGATPQAIASRRLTETPTSLPVLRETVPGGLDRVVSKALARTSVDRYASGRELAEALAAPEVWEETKPRRKMGRRALDAAIAVVLLGAGLFLAQLFTGGGPTVETDPNLIAVLPLVSAAGGDTALDNLGHAVAARISADLDGIGEIRVVDYATIRATEEATAGTPEDAAEWTHAETGAGRVIQGSLTRVGAGEVGVDLALYDSDRELLARASFASAYGEPWALADSLTWRLLDQIWSAGGDDSRDYYYRVLLRGRPFTAVREYLLADGSHWDWKAANRDKAEGYERAFLADTTLWMAAFMNDYLTTSGFFVEPGVRDTSITAAWREHVDELPAPHQLWIEAWDLPFDSATTYLRLEEMLQPSGTIPRGNFGPILFRYADWLFHGARSYGYSIEYTLDQIEAAIDRGFGAELYEHLYMASIGKDGSTTQRWVEWWLARGGAVNNPDRYRFIRLLMSRLGGARDSALADSVVRSWVDPGTEQIGMSWWVGLPDLGVELGRSLSALELEENYKVGLLSPMAISWAIRGAWDSALVSAARRDRESEDEAAQFGYRLSVLGESLGGLQTGGADEFRPGALAFVDKYGDEYPEDRLWQASVDGLLAAVRLDAEGLADARRRAEAVQDDLNAEDWPQDPVSYVVRSLRAYEAGLAGDRRGATDSLYAVEWEHPQSPRPGGFSHVRGINRLTVGRWLLAAGDTVRAQKMITALQFGMMEDWTAHLMVGPAYLELARIEDARGQEVLARDYYEQFLRRYDMPVEAHRPMVEEARAAYERLGGDAGRFD